MRTLAALAVLLLVAACQAPPPEMTEAERAQIQAEVMPVAEDWQTVWKDMDTDCEAASNLLHPEHFVWFWRGSRIDRDGFLEYCTASTRNRTGYDGAWTDTEVRVLSPDAAFFVGSYEATYETANGAVTRYPTAGQIILFERTGTGWGITYIQNFNGPAEVIREGEG